MMFETALLGVNSILGFLLGTALLVVTLFLILLILVQRGKGGGLAGALGGMGGESALGTKAGDVFTRITVVTALIWILLCMLTYKVYEPPKVESADPRGAIGGASTTGDEADSNTDGSSTDSSTDPSIPANPATNPLDSFDPLKLGGDLGTTPPADKSGEDTGGSNTEDDTTSPPTGDGDSTESGTGTGTDTSGDTDNGTSEGDSTGQDNGDDSTP